MVDALFVLVLVRLAAALVHALLRHIDVWRDARRARGRSIARCSPCWVPQIYLAARNILEGCDHRHRGLGAKLSSDREAFFFGIEMRSHALHRIVDAVSDHSIISWLL
jgi:hypothetical protein